MTLRPYLSALFTMLGVVTAPASALAECKLLQIAEFHVIREDRMALVDAVIDGKPMRLRIDTGSFATGLSPAAAATLGLNAQGNQGSVYGVGGSDTMGIATVPVFELAGAQFHNVKVAVMGRRLNNASYVGLLGEDLLSRTDVDFDFAHGVMRLIEPKGCQGDQVAYWAKAYSLASIAPSFFPTDLDTYVTLNGRQMRAQIDTGSPTSIVATKSAESVGVTFHSKGSQAVERSHGLGPASLATAVGTFDTFGIGDETIHNARLRMADLFGANTEVETGSRIQQAVGDFPAMLLGFDFFMSHHVYVAHSQGKIYFTFNGGQIFEAESSDRLVGKAPTAPTDK